MYEGCALDVAYAAARGEAWMESTRTLKGMLRRMMEGKLGEPGGEDGAWRRRC